MTAIFADASFYIALGNPRDELHAVASNVSESCSGRIVTTDYVLLEVANYLSATALRSWFVQLIRQLSSDASTNVISASPDLWSRGLDLYATRVDKSWSLTDCISFLVMQDQSIDEALTADRHFEQAGFMILLK